MTLYLVRAVSTTDFIWPFVGALANLALDTSARTTAVSFLKAMGLFSVSFHAMSNNDHIHCRREEHFMKDDEGKEDGYVWIHALRVQLG